MKNLKLGYGARYSSAAEWTNLDFVSSVIRVIFHNLLMCLPCKNETFDFDYNSHVLEHFSKEDGAKLIEECYRVLKLDGTIRTAIPYFEQIAKNYIKFLEAGVQKTDDQQNRENYEWMLIEMYDQTVRSQIGGNMAKYIYQDKICNEDFLYERIGEEGRAPRKGYLTNKAKPIEFGNQNQGITKRAIASIKYRFRKMLIGLLDIDEKALKIGKFRLGGEIHQWIYDRYSLANLLNKKGGEKIEVRTAFTSNVTNWAAYGIDGREGKVKKPDSLFIEANKK
jgi:predicted SAM-dependent methyltransferase